MTLDENRLCKCCVGCPSCHRRLGLEVMEGERPFGEGGETIFTEVHCPVCDHRFGYIRDTAGKTAPMDPKALAIFKAFSKPVPKESLLPPAGEGGSRG